MLRSLYSLSRFSASIRLLLVGLDLLFDEAAGGVGILALVAQARLDEDRHHRLHDALGALGVGIGVGEGVQVVATGFADLRGPW